MKKIEYKNLLNGMLGIAAASLVLISCIYLNEPFVPLQLALVACVVMLFVRKGWPGYFKGVTYMMLALGLPFYLIFAILGYAFFQDDLADAKNSRALIDDNRSKYEKYVSDFQKHMENDTVFMTVNELERMPMGPISAKLLALYFGGTTAFMPENLGPEPFRPVIAGQSASSVVMLMDIEGSIIRTREAEKIIAEKLGIEVSEVSVEHHTADNLPKVRRVFSYACLMDDAGDLLHLSAFDPSLIHLDLTNDPIFSPIGEACEEVIESGETHSWDDFGEFSKRVRDLYNIPSPE